MSFGDAPRSCIAKSEGLASTRVEGWEITLARSRSGTPFHQFVGRGTIRNNYDESLREKVEMWRGEATTESVGTNHG